MSNTKDLAILIKKQIENYGKKININEVGEVFTIGDGIAFVSGLDNTMYGEILEFEQGQKGIAFNLEEDMIGVVVLNNANQIKEGDIVKRTKKLIFVPVGEALIGRVINALGEPLDGKGEIVAEDYKSIFKIAPGIMTRQAVKEPLETGILAIDAIIPIGKGQRELIIGDRQTGKTSIVIDAIINQKNKNVRCIYVAIGQKNSTIAQITEKLNAHDAMSYTTILMAAAWASPTLQYIAPYAGITIAEHWMSQGHDVLIVYDDLSKHAVAYRTISLLLRRPPGREAYPGDVFYLHSQLLERAANLNAENGGGSITALPIIETQSGDISAYIPTNVISITDGQIFTKVDLFNSGQRPAIDFGFSVSRVGSTAQTPLMKKSSASLKLELAQYNEMLAFSQFGSDLDEITKNILNHGEKIYELLKQPQYKPLDMHEQSILLISSQNKIIDIVPTDHILDYKKEIFIFFNESKKTKKIIKKIKLDKNLDSKTTKELIQFIQNFTDDFMIKYGFQNKNKENILKDGKN